jgi:hypothetical protein
MPINIMPHLWVHGLRHVPGGVVRRQRGQVIDVDEVHVLRLQGTVNRQQQCALGEDARAGGGTEGGRRTGVWVPAAMVPSLSSS